MRFAADEDLVAIIGPIVPQPHAATRAQLIIPP
jgi:hypothetical protein